MLGRIVCGSCICVVLRLTRVGRATGTVLSGILCICLCCRTLGCLTCVVVLCAVAASTAVVLSCTASRIATAGVTS